MAIFLHEDVVNLLWNKFVVIIGDSSKDIFPLKFHFKKNSKQMSKLMTGTAII